MLIKLKISKIKPYTLRVSFCHTGLKIFSLLAKEEILQLSLSWFTLLVEVAHFSLRAVFVRAAFQCFGASFRAPREIFSFVFCIRKSSTLMFWCKLDENEMGDFCKDGCLRVMIN